MGAPVIRSLAALLLAGAAAATDTAPSGAAPAEEIRQFNPCNPKIKPCK